jgi:hypothetical protein
MNKESESDKKEVIEDRVKMNQKLRDIYFKFNDMK